MFDKALIGKKRPNIFTFILMNESSAKRRIERVDGIICAR